MSDCQPLTADPIQPVSRIPQLAGTKSWSAALAGLFYALSAGAIAWVLVQAVHPVFTNEEVADEYGFLPAEIQQELDRNNSMFVLALLGGLAGAGLAVGEGLRRKSWTATMATGAACAAVGVLFGSLAGYLGFKVFQFHTPQPDLPDLGKAMRVYAVMFATVGGGIGLGTGVLLGRHFRTAVRCAIAGVLGGVLASISYTMIVAILMPGAMTGVLIPVGAIERLLWFSVAAGLLRVIISSVAGRRIGIITPSPARYCDGSGEWIEATECLPSARLCP